MRLQTNKYLLNTFLNDFQASDIVQISYFEMYSDDGTVIYSTVPVNNYRDPGCHISAYSDIKITEFSPKSV